MKELTSKECIHPFSVYEDISLKHWLCLNANENPPSSIALKNELRIYQVGRNDQLECMDFSHHFKAKYIEFGMIQFLLSNTDNISSLAILRVCYGFRIFIKIRVGNLFYFCYDIWFVGLKL